MTADPTSSVDFVPDFSFKVADNLLSRFQVHEGCPNLPGHCAVCGSSNGLMFDFGVEVEFFGHVYLCIANCFREAANRVGYYSTDQVEQIKSTHEKLVEAQQELIAENRDLHNAVDSFSRLRVDRFDADIDQLLLDVVTPESNDEDNGSAPVESTEPAGDEPVSPAKSEESSDKPVSRKARSTKSNASARSTDVSTDDSLEILQSPDDI